MTTLRPGRASARSRLLILTTLALLPALLAAAAETVVWDSVRDGDIEVRYAPEDARPARAVLGSAARLAPLVAREVGIPALGAITIVIAPDAAEFAALTSGGAPDWSVGCAFPTRGLVVVRSPRTDLSPLHLDQIIEHELAHVATGRALGDIRIPRWFDEGIATTVAGEWRLDENARLAAAARSDRLIPLAEITLAFPSDADDAALAYAQSFRAVELLIRESGANGIAGLIGAVGTSGSFEGGLRSLVGLGTDAFDEHFARSLRTRFRGPPVLLRGGLLFVALALLLAGAAASKALRGRRRVREWDEEDERRSRSTQNDTRWS